MVVNQAKSRPFIQGLWWYELRNDSADSTKGMLFYDYSPKKPYTAMQKVAPGW